MKKKILIIGVILIVCIISSYVVIAYSNVIEPEDRIVLNGIELRLVGTEEYVFRLFLSG